MLDVLIILLVVGCSTAVYLLLRAHLDKLHAANTLSYEAYHKEIMQFYAGQYKSLHQALRDRSNELSQVVMDMQELNKRQNAVEDKQNKTQRIAVSTAAKIVLRKKQEEEERKHPVELPIRV